MHAGLSSTFRFRRKAISGSLWLRSQMEMGNQCKNDCKRRTRRRRTTGVFQCPAASALALAFATMIMALSFRPATSLASTEAFLGRGLRGGVAGGNGAPGYAHPPRDPVLYDELEVHWSASAREIKKAYYRLAVQHHPDKKPGDAQAQDRFKRVSEAYQILQDESVRERYHRRGIGALEEDWLSWGGEEEGRGGGEGRRGERSTRMVDPMEVFRTFLGGGMFEHLIGPLSPRMIPVQDPDYHHRKSKTLAEDLERRLEVDVRGDSYWFDQAAWAEALQLRDESMGRQILRTVGYVYKNYALRSLGKLAPNPLQPEAIRGKIKFYSDQAHRVNNLVAAVSSTTRLYVHLQTRKPDGLESRIAGEEETVTRVKEALWRVHRVDVEHTVQRACKMVLRDPRVPPSVLKRRAEALMRLGRIFTAAAKGKNPDPSVFRFVENASDPMAGTAASAKSRESSPSACEADSVEIFAEGERARSNHFAYDSGDHSERVSEMGDDVGESVDLIRDAAFIGCAGRTEFGSRENSGSTCRCVEGNREPGGVEDQVFHFEGGARTGYEVRNGRPPMPDLVADVFDRAEAQDVRGAGETSSGVPGNSEGLCCCNGRDDSPMGRKEGSTCGPFMGDGERNDLVEATAEERSFGGGQSCDRTTAYRGMTRDTFPSHIAGSDGGRHGSVVLDDPSEERKIDGDCGGDANSCGSTGIAYAPRGGWCR